MVPHAQVSHQCVPSGRQRLAPAAFVSGPLTLEIVFPTFALDSLFSSGCEYYTK